ncbi:uncharacterized protein LOC135347048 isoform X4 [Halichondria panicea]|uniref:uncharacterized protein LOC135347048 isoform X4 n=1 Tax=Halichondria panicea TaxID=6063 RepID=UPI00312B5DA2
MAWKHKSKEANMTSSRDFSDYPSSEGMEEVSRTPGSRKPFSPIAEEECENDGDHMTSKQHPRNHTVSPRSSMSPNHSSVSPVSSGSDHSSRSPPTTHSHLPPPSSQPPPLPSSHARPHPPPPPPNPHPRINSHFSTKRIGFNSSATGPRTLQQHVPSGHVTLTPRSRKPYETHHLHYPKHTVGPLPPSQLSSGGGGQQYQWVPRPSGVGKPSYGPIIQDGQSNSSMYSYDPVAPNNNMGVVNSKLVPTKMYPTVTGHHSNRDSPDNGTNEVLIDPGERGSPSGESSPSSTPNSTLGKQIHRHMIESIHAVGSVGREGGEEEVKVQHNNRGTTTVQMGKVSLSIPNTRHHVNSHSTNQKPSKLMRTLEARKIDSEDSVRQIRTNVALKVSQFNQNGNHSGGATKNEKDASPTNDKDKDKSSSNGSAGPSPVGGASKISPTHSGTIAEGSQGRLVGDSRSSSVEELAIINDEEQTDSAHSEIPMLKPDPSKSKPHPPSGGQAHYPPPPHHSHHHADPYPTYVSLSQPPPQGIPQGITQGIVPPPSLSQQDHRYMYDPHRAELAYTTHTGMYPAHPSMAYEAAASRHHHISPPHSSQAHAAHSSQAHAPHQYIVAHHGYRPPPHDYIGSHEHHPGSHEHHMSHRGLPPGMQYMRSDQQQYSPSHHMTNKLPRHEPFSKNNVSLAHEAAANGDIKTLHHMLSSHEVDTYGSNEHHFSLAHKAALHGRLPIIQFLVESGLPSSALQIPDDSFTTPAMLAIQLLMDFGYSMVHTDRENQKPVDWADAMGQNICVRYLMMYETCWALSGELTHMAEQLAIVQKDNGQLRDAFSSLEKEHESAITKLLTSHEERLTKMREHHVDLMASILHMNQDTPPTGGGGATAPSANKNRSQVPVRKAPPEPPTTPKRSSNRPPVPPDPAAKKRSRGSKDRGHEAADKGEDHNTIDYRTATPQEVLE